MILFCVVAALVFGGSYLCGVFAWVDKRLNNPPPRKGGVHEWMLDERVKVLEGKASEMKSEIDKLNLALSVKTFKKG